MTAPNLYRISKGDWLLASAGAVMVHGAVFAVVTLEDLSIPVPEPQSDSIDLEVVAPPQLTDVTPVAIIESARAAATETSSSPSPRVQQTRQQTVASASVATSAASRAATAVRASRFEVPQPRSAELVEPHRPESEARAVSSAQPVLAATPVSETVSSSALSGVRASEASRQLDSSAAQLARAAQERSPVALAEAESVSPTVTSSAATDREVVPANAILAGRSSELVPIVEQASSVGAEVPSEQSQPSAEATIVPAQTATAIEPNIVEVEPTVIASASQRDLQTAQESVIIRNALSSAVERDASTSAAVTTASAASAGRQASQARVASRAGSGRVQARAAAAASMSSSALSTSSSQAERTDQTAQQARTVEQVAALSGVVGAALRSSIREILDDVECANLRPSYPGDALRVDGFVATEADRARLAEQLGALTNAPPDLASLEIVEPPFCGVIETSLDRNIDGSPTIRLDEDDGVFREGELLVVFAQAPEGEAGYLYVDYIDIDGTVVHMLPSSFHQDAKIEGAQTIQLGVKDAALGGTSYELREPHGRGMVVAHWSLSRIFETPRPETERAETYLPELEDAVAAAEHEVTRSHVFIEIRAR